MSQTTHPLLKALLYLSLAGILLVACQNNQTDKDIGFIIPEPTFKFNIEPEVFSANDSLTVVAQMGVKGREEKNYKVGLTASTCLGGGRWNVLKQTNQELIYRLPLDLSASCRMNSMVLSLEGELEMREDGVMVYWEQEYHLFPLDSGKFTLGPVPDTLKVDTLHTEFYFEIPP